MSMPMPADAVVGVGVGGFYGDMITSRYNKRMVAVAEKRKEAMECVSATNQWQPIPLCGGQKAKLSALATHTHCIHSRRTCMVFLINFS